MGGKGPDTQTTTSTQRPPDYLKPYIKSGLRRAENLYQNQPLYPSRTLPGTARYGYRLGGNIARDPQLIDPAVDQARSTIAGDYLGADALRDAARAELDQVVGGTLGSFEAAGRSGSGLAMNALGRGVTSALGPAYMQERRLQQQAMMGAPGLEQARYMPAQQLINLGMGQRGAEERYYQEPWDRLARYTGIALGNAPAQLAGGTTIGQQPIYQPNPLQQALGLGMMGLGFASGIE